MDSLFTSQIMDVIQNRSCVGGLFKYTTESGFRAKNLICAYNYNDAGRYGYNLYDDGEIKPTGAKYLENNQLKESKPIKDIRGEGYFVGYRTQNGFKYKTVEEFSLMGKLFREEVSKYRGETNPVIKKYLKPSSGFTSQHNYGDEYSIRSLSNTVLKANPNIPTEGLYSYYSKNREYFNEKNMFTYNKAYGISSEGGEEKYSINEVSDYNGNVIINNNDKNGFITLDKNNNVVYNYYDGEADANGVGFFSADSVIDGTTVHQYKYMGSSSLIKKTNELFENAKIGSLINRFHTADGVSRGRNLLTKGGVQNSDTGYDNPYCRVWTAHHQYARLQDRIRPFYDGQKESSVTDAQKMLPEKMRPFNGAERLGNNTVLQNNGFVRISPSRGEGNQDLKNCMFSIENLAWRDIKKIDTQLSKEQIGPNNGRIMWFPPYNLKFNENVSVNWNANNFIGRGEQIYTYTNTERSGTLSFTLLIDHPSIVNTWRGTAEEVNEIKEAQDDLLRFFAGCGTLNESLTDNGKKIEVPKKEIIDNITPKPSYSSKDIAYVVFFANDYSGIDNIEEGVTGLTENLIKYEYQNDPEHDNFNKRDKSFEHENLQKWNLINKNSKYLLNSSNSELNNVIKKTLFGSDDEKIEIKHLEDIFSLGENFSGDEIFGMPAGNCKIDKIDIKGFATKNHGYNKNNIELCNRRGKVLKKLILTYASQIESDVFNDNTIGLIDVPDIDGRKDINGLNAKICRAAVAIFHITWRNDVKPVNPSVINNLSLSSNKTNKNISESSEKSNIVLISNENYTYDNEYMYFSSIRGDKLIYKNIVDKVKYFDPAYHSITPEGFNARLTFLHQCTRQGPTVTSNGIGKSDNNYLDYAGNLGFGRAPYCILRIGDFFNTKICIDSLSIDYDNGGGIQWDLNPEGAGVQPMFANVNINFKFIGGQDIAGPIERLQNAVTANYYANTSIYDRHSDNEETYYDAVGQTINNETKHRIEKIR